MTLPGLRGMWYRVAGRGKGMEGALLTFDDVADGAGISKDVEYELGGVLLVHGAGGVV